MDFTKLREKALELKKKAEKKGKEAIDYGAKKLAKSNFTINSKEDFEKFIEKSKETSFTNKETGAIKKYPHRVIVIVGDEKSEFFKKSLYQLPVLATKSFSQNTPIKLAKQKITGVDFKKYKVSSLPAILVFENEKILKVLSGEENISKLVKSFDLNINSNIDTL